VQLAEIAQNLLDNVSGQLNSKINGRFVFAGSRTTTRPVTVPVPNPTNFGTPDSTYYQGDSLKLTARLDESTTITYGITGDRIEFQNAIGALKAAIEGANTNNRTLKNTALSLAETAIQGLAGLRTEMGVDMDSISRANSRNNDFLLFTEGMISDIENVDIAFTVARLATEQTILQASYMTLARVTSLSLVDFL
jgi:flagellar hook-associated protein 3 FlgL